VSEIICKETSCAFNEDHGCLKRTVRLEQVKVEIKASAVPIYCCNLLHCLEYERRHESEVTP
jgi:hypothetical protein